MCIGSIGPQYECVEAECKAPQLGACGIKPPFEDGFVLRRGKCHIFLVNLTVK